MAWHSLSYSLIDYPVLATAYSKKQAVDSAKFFVAPDRVKAMQEKIIILNGALNTQSIDEAVKRTKGKRFEKTTLYFGGRFTATKGGDFATECYDLAYKTGKDVEIKVTTPSKSGKVASVKEKAKEVEFFTDLSQEEAWDVMVQSHISIFPQTLRMLPSAVFEQIYAGLIVIVNRKNNAGLLPPEYPFFYDTEDEARAMLRFAIMNYDDAVKKVQGFGQWVKENNSLDASIKTLFDKIYEDYEADMSHFRSKPFVTHLCTKILKEAKKEVQTNGLSFRRLCGR